MEIAAPEDWAIYCQRGDLPGRRLAAHPGEVPVAFEQFRVPGDIAVAIGPEGGFTDEEVAQARAAGWQIVGLGPRILRVETAALALAAMIGSAT